ncbi:glycosyltransferase family 4 protein [Adhaeribacter sp. BT258]|uniref:Glycosyltransferase family 4 protein n=1 Tax=Adhaeribacter terrigena TaxID=2793070 RepID=A0ABS1BYD5_9BACT|nr:glycosyltransferase family 4 protein [Adhaeribacter terrigena]MBK0401917.1 glycosyltransferase family 4 protein [Adhaeribacter terrigena]
MKVLFVCSGNIKGFEVIPFIKEQGESLKKVGIDVDYFPIVGKGLHGYFKASLELRKHLKVNQYDLIHAHFTHSGWSAVLASGRTPVVLSLMGSDAYGEYIGVNKVQLKSRANTLLTYLIQPFTKAIISKSQNIEDYVYLKHKSYIIPNGINKEKFKPATTDFRSELGLDPEKKQILFLGSRTNVRKNFALVKDALEHLNRTDVELINPYPVSHEMIPKYLNAAHVLVVPSLMEGSPNVLKEAMACNCPIVSTDMGDAGWVFGNTEGCYLSSFKPQDFAEKIKQALEFSERKGRTEGEKRILDLGLDAETIAQRVKGIYQLALR